MRVSAGAREVLPLSSTTFYILLSLADADRHGYAISKEVAELTGGEVALPPATLYRMMKQLLADGWIKEIDAPGDDAQRRRSYRLTARGRDVARAEAARLAVVVRAAQSRKLLPAGAL